MVPPGETRDDRLFREYIRYERLRCRGYTRKFYERLWCRMWGGVPENKRRPMVASVARI